MSVAYDLTEVPFGPADAGLPRRRPLAVVPAPNTLSPGRRPQCESPDAPGSPVRGGSVSVLHAPLATPTAGPVRLTRRGIGVLTVAVAVACAGLWWLAAQTASGSAAAGTPHHAPSAVTVAPGDTLWDIAARVAPQRDPRAEVADLTRRNHLSEAAIVPGQVLQIR
jgi:LysM repeat protein